jgi:hypothetical protein
MINRPFILLIGIAFVGVDDLLAQTTENESLLVGHWKSISDSRNLKDNSRLEHKFKENGGWVFFRMENLLSLQNGKLKIIRLENLSLY